MHLLLHRAPGCARVYAAMTLQPQALLLGRAGGCRRELRAASSSTSLSRASANQATLTSFDVICVVPACFQTPQIGGFILLFLCPVLPIATQLLWSSST